MKNNFGLDLKLELLKNIAIYYPIGLPYLNDKYPGYHNLIKIIENKINTLIKEGKIEPWATFVDELKIVFPEKRLIDKSYTQFPNLSLWIELNLLQDTFLKRISKLNLNVSLLVPYYTVFFEEEIVPIGLFDENYPPPKSTSFYKNLSLVQEKEYFNKINQLITAFYPEYIYIDFHLLNSTKVIGAIPHGEDSENNIVSYPMFNFLFGLYDNNEPIKFLHYKEDINVKG